MHGGGHEGREQLVCQARAFEKRASHGMGQVPSPPHGRRARRVDVDPEEPRHLRGARQKRALPVRVFCLVGHGSILYWRAAARAARSRQAERLIPGPRSDGRR
ncbi:hypothetical protein SCOCK_140162 [Actinacidiphila cocklensis]|uniref:Uncharacterized protein n=1 Tax=Actinacidiphila cocklensis TaxID=887465 RepID=A0A9W4GPV2_9ACTN|nr:hypothetical protein SCOCK_140162 [Actinacidiphila cocklensis]